MGNIRAICISKQRGTAKTEVAEAELTPQWGILGDAHGGPWHRQVSMLSVEKIQDFQARGAEVDFGAFGENLVVEGFDFAALPVGSRFRIGDVVLEMTQIGKECHNHCQIYQRMGECIMPKEGVFARVLQGGRIKRGDEIQLVLPDANRPYTAAVITLSDKGAKGEREDKSGPLIVKMLEEAGYQVEETLLLPDEQKPLEQQLMDVTPEATIAVCDRMARGIAEAIRGYSMTITKRAMLSRAESGIRKGTLIVNLPGSPKAVKESLEFVLPVLEHGLGILRGTEGECGRN